MNLLRMLAIWFICVLSCILGLLMMLFHVLRGSARGWVQAVAYDQSFNAAIGGDPDKTISHRAAVGSKQGIPKWCLLCKLLDLLDPNHCQKSEGV